MRNASMSPKAIASSGRSILNLAVALVLVFLMCGTSSSGYSVLTHEEIVDLLWTSEIRSLLLKRYPGLTEDQITEAHAYAYGGAVIQDLGYYPFGSVEFSDLVHYVRSGDFVRELLLESQDVNEYAFGLGALSHYASDITGHPAVNEAVAIEYPKLRAKYGKSIRYAQDKTAHIKTEFGFDMAQVAKNRYASQQYHDFIGFKVSKSLLERVFPVVYGMKLQDVMPNEDLAIGSYRYSVSRLIPQMTQVALQTHKKELIQETPDFSKREFLYRLSRSEYEKEWGKDYTKPGFGTRVLSTLLRFMPKIGPFKAMAFNNPTPQTEDMYFKSINATVDQYNLLLQEERKNSLVLPDRDLDSGKATTAAEYTLTDETYAKLLSQLTAQKFTLTTTPLQQNILQFYSDLSAPIETKKDPAKWQGVLTSLDQLKSVTPNDDKVATDSVAASVSTTGDREKAPIIVIGFVGGFIKRDDPVHSEVQLAARLRKAYPFGVDVETFENYHGAEARKKVMVLLDTNHDGSPTSNDKQNARIIIYGHSWGGSEAIALARELEEDGIPVLLTIQVDSIAKLHRDDAVIPANVARAVNFYQPDGFLHGQSDIRAADPTRTKILGNFRFDYKASLYNCDEYPWYDHSMAEAHTQIECDPRVWEQAEALIRSDLPPVTGKGLKP
jgi:hypothetical protein